MPNETEKATTISQPLLLMLIETIQDLTREVGELRGRNDLQDKHLQELASNVECLHRETEKFRRRFEPYLLRAVDASKVTRSRREKVITGMLSVMSVGALVFTGEAIYDAIKERLGRPHVSGADVGPGGPGPRTDSGGHR